MPQTFDLIIKNGTLVNHDGESRRDIGIISDRIAAIGDLGSASAAEVLNATGLHILPGVIDTQVHFREPGFPHKEDLRIRLPSGGPRRRHCRLRHAEHQAFDDGRGRARR